MSRVGGRWTYRNFQKVAWNPVKTNNNPKTIIQFDELINLMNPVQLFLFIYLPLIKQVYIKVN